MTIECCKQLLYSYDERDPAALRRSECSSKCPLNIACGSSCWRSDGASRQIVGQRSWAGSTYEGSECRRAVIDFQIGKRSAAVIHESNRVCKSGPRQRGRLIDSLFQSQARVARRSHGAQVAYRIGRRKRGIGISVGEAGRDGCIVRSVERRAVGNHLFHDQAEAGSGSDGYGA